MKNRKHRLALHVSVEVPRLGKPSAEDFCQAQIALAKRYLAKWPKQQSPIALILHTTIPMTARNDVLTPTCPN